ncbi:hypothetical protein F7Q99_06805 [Streptomyces kaniharaensis]|uniref:Uncharacterized protein n=1 Tax=Streptomyces kaniharaensis TaxID=212423 RepID=A0A6N7KKW3_9ACTN|nr:hypothetical protein [Streptomyces kaniharaensis]MQS12011.1 hypothetical protein [Streptomyces kaniharaensis]
MRHMTDQHDTAPAVWDPTARGGAGGWVRGQRQPDADARASAPQPPPASPVAPPPAPGEVGDQGPLLGARPYLATAPGFDAPTAPAFPQVAPQPPPAPPTVPPPAPPASPFPAHATAQAPGPGYQYPPQPPYPAQPDYPTGYEDLDDDQDRSNNRKAPLLIGFALLMVLAIGGGLLMAVKDDDKKDQAAPAPPAATTAAAPSGNPQPAPAPTGSAAAPSATSPDPASAGAGASPTATAGPGAKTQAAALDELLTQGENAKAPIGSAVAKVSSCPAKTDIDSAAQVFDNGAKQRDELLRKLSALTTTDVPGGADAVQSLKSAWQLSADIDRAYAAWARAVATQGCSGRAPTTPDKKHADELNPQATQAKTDFVGKWKPIADAFGLTPRTQDRI